MNFYACNFISATFHDTSVINLSYWVIFASIIVLSMDTNVCSKTHTMKRPTGYSSIPITITYRYYRQYVHISICESSIVFCRCAFSCYTYIYMLLCVIMRTLCVSVMDKGIINCILYRTFFSLHFLHILPRAWFSIQFFPLFQSADHLPFSSRPCMLKLRKGREEFSWYYARDLFTGIMPRIFPVIFHIFSTFSQCWFMGRTVTVLGQDFPSVSWNLTWKVTGVTSQG